MSKNLVMVVVLSVLTFAPQFASAEDAGPETKSRNDIATAGRAVDDYNQRLHLRVTPTVIPTTSSGAAIGLGIGGSF